MQLFLNNSFTIFFEKVLSREKRKEKIAPLLWFLSQIYRFGVFWRHTFFEIGVFRIQKSPLFTVSIGNIAVGGTGKTSFVSLLAGDMGKGVAILSRGYRALEKHQGVVENANQGDEAFLLASKHREAIVIVGKNRKKGAALAKKMDAKWILLDDGMQHRALSRDIEIVMVHSNDLFKKEEYLPLGRLRDQSSRLRHADYVVIHGVDTPALFEAAKEKIGTKTNAPIIGTSYVIENPNQVRGKTVGAFCALARPMEFYEILHKLGCRIVKTETLPDHVPLQNPEKFFTDCKAAGAECIVCTEKDFVKLSKQAISYGIVPLHIQMEVSFGKEHYLKLLEKIRQERGHGLPSSL